ncbi:non-specific serine/threonine protein kinase [Amycolatopsis tolypomycina]|uniref:Non-specific serine/threonine protein kinase n=1 Tax=Amycolatopsis tolypomycina TaxID=208445 RepID=A0A1H4JI97_9PSEU|nr:LuxR C-terminal-related transcriptional regulator [Amycolatopsis tolypomycina]SEB46003.1 non-specific serine/threonine protein kinase [Amycolatopsis tolypomycina]
MTESGRSVEPADSEGGTDEWRGDASPSVEAAEITSFVGRAKLISETKSLLRTARLITLFGPGGVGKSRLLRRLSTEHALADGFPDGVWVVELADIPARENLLAAGCADQLGIGDNADGPSEARLIEFFRQRRALLMLDNCEHLIDDVRSGQVPALLTTLLPAAPALTVVTTSRVRLGVSGEHIVKIHPLLPTEALYLLLDRARAAGTAISEPEYPLALRLCEMLDGLPLAIELAAGQLDVMTLREIVDHPELLRLLVDGPYEQHHHRTMHATIKWSYDLLGEREQRMLTLVSIFEGGFDLEAATSVCADNGIDTSDVPSLLKCLVRKSLLLTESASGRTRYRMLELVRRFGLQITATSGMEPEIRTAHAHHFLALASRARKDWFSARQTDLMRQLRAELPNFRAAQVHFLSANRTVGHGITLSVDIGASCAFVYAGVLNDSRRMLTRGLERHPAEPSMGQLAALCLISWMAQIQGSEAAGAAQAEAEDVARQLGCSDSFGPLLYSRGTRLWLAEPDPVRARDSIALMARAEEAFREAGEEGLEFMAALYGAMSTVFLSGPEAAFAASARVLELARAAEAQWCISWAKWTCGLAELLHGDAKAAAAHTQEALQLQLEINDKWGPPWSLWQIALIALRLGDYERGARLLGGARVAQRLTQTSVLGMRPFLLLQQQIESTARQRFGNEFEIQIAVGESLARSMDEVYDLAKEPFAAAEDAPVASQHAEMLTKRELEVAELVAKALTNPAIGQALGISSRTVEKHVENILLKWGLTSRTEIAVRYLRDVAPANG